MFIPPAGSTATNVVDGGLVQRIDTPSRTVWAWRATGEQRLSVAVTARLTAAQPAAQVGLACGIAFPGEKHLTGWVSADGSWEIEVNGEVVGRGAASERQAELLERFVLRLDCVTASSPTTATLLLNGTPLGRADGREPFPMSGAEFRARPHGGGGFDLWAREFTVSRLH